MIKYYYDWENGNKNWEFMNINWEDAIFIVDDIELIVNIDNQTITDIIEINEGIDIIADDFEYIEDDDGIIITPPPPPPLDIEVDYSSPPSVEVIVTNEDYIENVTNVSPSPPIDSESTFTIIMPSSQNLNVEVTNIILEDNT